MNDQSQTKQPFSFAYLRHMLVECQRAGYRLSSFEKYDRSIRRRSSSGTT